MKPILNVPKNDGPQIRTDAEAKKHRLVRRVRHCGMPLEVYEDKDTKKVDEKVFCYGCHHWIDVEKCEAAKENADAKKN